MKTQEVFTSLLAGKALSQKTAHDIFLDLFQEKLTEAEAKSLLLLLAQKGESAEEMAGCLEALRSLEVPKKTNIPHLMDTCGTGGDGSCSINISTIAALIIAGAGGRVAKHGNRSLSSKCGSSDLLEAFGVNLDAGEAKMIQAIQEVGIGYFHAPFFHPVYSRIQPLRKKLGVRTLFNSLGPLVNPLRLSSQLVGVSRKSLVKDFAEVLKRSGTAPLRVLVAFSENGMDELTTAESAFCAFLEKGKIKYIQINPQKFGFKKSSIKSLKGGSIEENKKIAEGILTGKIKNAARDTVILNAGAGLWISGLASDLKEGITKAEKALDSGRAYEALQKLVKISSKGSKGFRGGKKG